MSQIKVLITDETNSSGSTSSVGGSATKSSLVNEKGKIKSSDVASSDKSSKSLAVASMIATQMFNYATSNVGKWTGSTRKQTSINNARQIIGIGAMAYVSPLVAIANVGVNLATTAIDTAYEERWDRYSKENARRKAGELKGRGR